MAPTIPIDSAAPSRVAGPDFGEELDEAFSLVDAVVVAGPPVALLTAPLVLGALLLVGPFALIATVAVMVGAALAAAAAVFALLWSIVTAPRQLVRRRRDHRGGVAA